MVQNTQPALGAAIDEARDRLGRYYPPMPRVKDPCPGAHPFKLTVTEFKIWFDGFAAAVESTQTSWVLPEQWILLKKKIEEL